MYTYLFCVYIIDGADGSLQELIDSYGFLHTHGKPIWSF